MPLRAQGLFQYIGSAAQQFSIGGLHPAHGGAPIIEVDYAIEGDVVVQWWQDNYAGWLRRRQTSIDAASATWTESPSGDIGMVHRFGCIIDEKIHGYYYSFGIKNWPTMDVFGWKSADGIIWTEINDGVPVLTHSSLTASPWHNIWNVVVSVDGAGVFHLLAECAPDGVAQAGCGLGYSYATMDSNSINFDVNKTVSHVIPYGGNPCLKFLPDRNVMLCIHGMIYDPGAFTKTPDYWYITASTASIGSDLSSPASWTTHRDSFSIGEMSIHVADPAFIGLPSNRNNRLMLSYSYNQNQLWTDFSSSTLNDFYDVVSSGGSFMTP